jgi:hypothetical protein
MRPIIFFPRSVSRFGDAVVGPNLSVMRHWSDMQSPEANAKANRRLREDLDSMRNVVPA